MLHPLRRRDRGTVRGLSGYWHNPAMSLDPLYEIRNVQQVPGEPRRRWFFSHEMDLIVWFDEQSKPVSFQLSYDKHRWVERAIRWKAGHGYSHFRMAGGMTEGGGGPSSELLVPDSGPFDAARIRAKFLALSSAMPPPIAGYVADRLRAHPAHRLESDVREALITTALIAISFALILACLKSPRTKSRGHRRD